MFQTTKTAHWVLSPHDPPLQNAIVSWQDSKIKAVTATAEVLAPDLTTFVTPGLINTHTHLELYHETPLLPQPDESLSDWLLRVIAHSRPLSPQDKANAAWRSAQECLATGTTTVNDISSSGASVSVLDAVGLRGIVSPEFFWPASLPPDGLHPVVSLVQQLQSQWAGHATLQVGVSPHSPYNVSPTAWRAVVASLPPDTPVHAHLAESQAEWDYFMLGASALDTVHQRVLGRVFGPEFLGVSPTQAVEPCLTQNTTVAHGVYCTPEDEALLVASHVGMAHCLRSNLLLNQQTITNLQARLKNGMRLGLGTDSRLSCPDLDLRAEARAVQAHHGLSACQVFELATWGGACALHQDTRLGLLKPGYLADMVLWEHPDSPWEDPYVQWLSPQTRVKAIWVHGVQVYPVP